MLLVHNDIALGKKEYRNLIIYSLEEVNFEAIRTAQIFLSTFTLILDALHVCDLAKYKVSVAENFKEIKYIYLCHYFIPVLFKASDIP